MRVFSHARLAWKNVANIQMGSASSVSAAERWASNYWGDDPPAAPLGICRVVCAASKPQRLQGLTMRTFSGYKMT